MRRTKKFMEADLVVRITAAGWLVEKDRTGPSGVIMSTFELSKRVLELGDDRVLMLNARPRRVKRVA